MRIKKSRCMLFCISMWLLILSFACAEESIFYWPMEENSLLAESGNRIIEFHPASSAAQVYEIPSNWIPLSTIQHDSGLYFAEITNDVSNINSTLSIYSWNSGVISEICRERRLDLRNLGTNDLRNKTMIYHEGKLYIYIDHKRYCLDIAKGETLYCVDVQGDADTISLWPENDGDCMEISFNKAPDDRQAIVIYIDGSEYIVENASDYAYEAPIPYHYHVGRADGIIYTWMPLSGEEIPSLSLYSQGEESSEEYRQPIHEIYHLVQIDVSSQKYHTVFNRQGEPVALMDMRPIWSNMIYLAERNAFLILCEDHNPMHNLEACEFRLAGRELLIEVDLDEKEISALYVSGREMPDYDALWTYCWKMYGTKHGNGATYTPLTGDELTRFHELITGKPLRQENHSAIDQWFTMPALAYEIKSIDQ